MNTELFNADVQKFMTLANKYKVQMLLVGGGAVNFHGYQRHSADVDFWIDISTKNIDNLKLAILEFGIELVTFPEEVLNGLQNISIKISPISEIELITNFNSGCGFSEAYKRRKIIENDFISYYQFN